MDFNPRPDMTPPAPGARARDTRAEDSTRPTAEVRASIQRDIAAPLAVLRAAMESLSVELQDAPAPQGTVDGALEQVVRLGQSVQGLVDYALPPALHPQSCSAEELLRSIHAQLEPCLAPRVTLACEDGAQRAVLDGAVLARRIAHLVAASAGDAHEALLRCRVDAGELELSLSIQRLTGHGHPTWEDGLAGLLTQRDLERMGGEFTSTQLRNSITFSARFTCEGEARS